MNNDFEIMGWRFVEDELKVGDVLLASRIWDGDQPTDDDLRGTCAFNTRARCEEYARWSAGYIVCIGGTDNGTGDLAGEIIIEDATVITVDAWG